MRRKTLARLRGAALGMVALLLAGSAGAAEPARPLPVVAGKVTHVNDGDSIEVELGSGRVRIRMSAIDTPEYDQPYGATSSAALRALLPIGSPVELEVVTQDQFRRMVATVWRVDGDKRVNINEAMLLQGHAWAYRRYMKEPRFCDLEEEARAQKLGLWAQPVGDWVYPPEWRFLRNGEIRALPATAAETHARCIEVLGLAGKATYEPPK
jgi:endonuclease YncB( thermonuclease family)